MTSPIRDSTMALPPQDFDEVAKWEKRTGKDFRQEVRAELNGNTRYIAELSTAYVQGADVTEIVGEHILYAMSAVVARVRADNALEDFLSS